MFSHSMKVKITWNICLQDVAEFNQRYDTRHWYDTRYDTRWNIDVECVVTSILCHKSKLFYRVLSWVSDQYC